MTRYVMGQVKESCAGCAACVLGIAFAAEFFLSPFSDSNNWYFTEDIYRKQSNAISSLQNFF